MMGNSRAWGPLGHSKLVTLITAQSPRYLNVNKQPNESTNEFGVQGSSFDERMNELVALLIAILWSIALMATCICADLGIFRPSFGDSPNTRLVSCRMYALPAIVY
jgi:hypothetical protein